MIRMTDGLMRIKFFPVILLCIAFTSCGVYSFTGASIDPSVKTFTIHPFTNQASIVVPGLSQQLTDALRNKLLSNTSLAQATDNGDLEFTGAVTNYVITPAAATAAQTASLNRLTISVQIEFTNHQNDKQSWSQSFSRYADYDSNKDLNSIQSQLIKEINDQLVDDIFNKAVVNW